MPEFIEQNWNLLSTYPEPFLIFGALCIAATAGFVYWVLNERLNAKDDLIDLLREQLAETRRNNGAKRADQFE